jgi:hypothetical protein
MIGDNTAPMSVPVNIEAARKELFGDDQHYPIVPYGQISRLPQPARVARLAVQYEAVTAASRANRYFRFRQSIFLFVQFRSHLC